MKQYAKYFIKEMGIDWYIAVKANYCRCSDNCFSLYDSIKMNIQYKIDKEQALSHFNWYLSMVKDFAQYQ